MSLILAFRAFIRALKHPNAARNFLAPPPKKKEPLAEEGHLRLLALLQHEGRLIDFLKEDLSGCSDAQIGAVVRKIHADCGKSLEEAVTVRPLLDEAEGMETTVAEGFDPAFIKLIGQVKGKPPYKGVIRHRGWKAHKLSLPKAIGEQKRDVLWPAEIEVR